MKSPLHYHMLLHFTVIVFGFTAILGKLITIPSAHIVWYRMLIAFGGLLIWGLMTKANFKQTPKEIAKFLGAGLLVAAHWILFFEAIKQSNVSIALAALSSTTLFVAVFEPLLYQRKVNLAEIVFGLCVMGGLWLIFSVESGAIIGIILGVMAAMLAALFGTINGLLVREYKPLNITFWEMVGGVLGATIFLVATGEMDASFFDLSRPLSDEFGTLLPPADNLWWLLILGLVCTSFAFVASVRVMKKLSPFTTALAINLEPVYGVLLALLFFPETETMKPGFYIGAAIILATIFANTLWKRRERRKLNLR